MKFISNEVYDNVNFRDVLFQPYYITKYKDYTLMAGTWYTKGTASVYKTVTQVIKVDSKYYDDWFSVDLEELK